MIPTRVFAIDHRPILVKACEERSQPITRVSEIKRLAVDAVAAARKARPEVADKIGILLDDLYGTEAIAAARAQGIPVAQPAEKGGVVPFEFARPDWKEAIVATKPAFIKVRIDGHPTASDRAQEDQLVELSKACEAASVPLVPEPLVRGGPEDAASIVRWIDELRAKGVKARAWKLEAFENPDDARRVADSLPESEGILILGKSATLEKVKAWFEAARVSPRFEGFAVGRTIFWEPFLAYLDGASPADTTKRLTDAFLAVLDLWQR